MEHNGIVDIPMLRNISNNEKEEREPDLWINENMNASMSLMSQNKIKTTHEFLLCFLTADCNCVLVLSFMVVFYAWQV